MTVRQPGRDPPHDGGDGPHGPGRHPPGQAGDLARWALNPSIGFLRAPFKVWRRVRKEDPTTPVAGTGPHSGPQDRPVRPRSRCASTPSWAPAGAPGRRGGRLQRHVLPGQRLAFTSGGAGRFRAAGISALFLPDGGQIANVGGLPRPTTRTFPTDPRRGRFPFAKGEIAPPDYDPVPQGRAAGEPGRRGRSPAAADPGRLIQRDPPAPGGGLAVPAWPFPDPATFDATCCARDRCRPSPTA